MAGPKIFRADKRLVSKWRAGREVNFYPEAQESVQNSIQIRSSFVNEDGFEVCEQGASI